MVLADIGAALRSALAFWRAQTPKAAGAVGLYTLAALAAAIEPALHWPPLWLMASSLIQLAISIVAYGALYRLALAQDHPGDKDFVPGPAGLQWRTTEWRLAGALLLTVFFAFIVMLAIAFVAVLVGIVVYVSQGAKPVSPTNFFTSTGGVSLMLVGLIGFVVLAWALLRLSLALPATADRKQVQVFSTWGLTRGHVLAILVTALIIGAPIFVLGLIAGVVQQDGAPGVVLALRTVMAILIGVAQLPLSIGAYGWFYRRLRPAPEAVLN